jgi:hypothetical protein
MPYVTIVFWGVLLFFGLRSGLDRGPGLLRRAVAALRSCLGVAAWGVAAVCFVAAIWLASIDSHAIRTMKGEVGIPTSMAFLLVVSGDVLLVSRLRSPESAD